MEKYYNILTRRFPWIPSKRFVLILVVIIGLFITNEFLFRWGIQHGWSENTTYDLTVIERFDNPYGPPGGSISFRSMDFDSKDNLWIGSNNSVTVLREDGSSRIYKIVWGAVTALTVDSFDQVWIGGEFGLRRLTEIGSWKLEWDNQLTGETVYALAADQQGQIWVATTDKLSKLSDGKWTHFDFGYSSIFSSAEDIVVDDQERVWIADMFYIGNLSPEGNWENSVFRLDRIRSIAIDEQTNIWARTNNGLSLCKGTKCSEYNYRNSALPSGSVAVFDNYNRLWLPYSTGIRVLNIDEVLPIPLLTGLLILRWAMSISLFLMVYFFVVRLSEKSSDKTTLENLTVKDILKRIWRNLVLIILLGMVFFLSSIIPFKVGYGTKIVLIVFFQGILILIRINSLMMGNRISKDTIIASTIIGTLITSGATAIIVFLIVIGFFPQ